MVRPRLTQQIADAFLPHPPDALGVAVSGGGDSMALLHLMHGFCALNNLHLRAVTVDHGLRPAAQDEAHAVARYCASLGVPHDTLEWRGWDGRGNLQAQARDARYGLMANWAKERGIAWVALGHTADDQAETVLMRLARRAGVDGLSAMPHRALRAGVTWVRPLLGASRAELRRYLREQGIDWSEDPSNEDAAYERIRARQAMTVLADLGIEAVGLSMVAAQMGTARKALDWQTFLAAREMVTVEAGALVIEDRRLRVLPEEIRRRLLVQAIRWISDAPYPPRRGAVATLMKALAQGQAATADGCHARRIGGNIWIFREFEAVRALTSLPGALWDTRWHIWCEDIREQGALREAGQEAAEGMQVRALGPEGLAQCPDWRATGCPRDVLLSTPAMWRGDTVVAAPLAGMGQNWHAEVNGGPDTFFASLLSH